jgi:peptide/nickel transport system ATP-binding protein
MRKVDRANSNQKEKTASYISLRESARIARDNRKITRAIERARNRRNIDPSEYVTAMHDPANVVEFDNVHTYYYTSVGVVKAVNGVSFAVPRGKVVGVVGESGCGKSVTGLSLMQLVPRPSGQTVEGEIRFSTGGGAYNLVKTPTKVMEKLRGKELSMIFQEPMSALNPVFRIGAQIAEVFALHAPEAERKRERIKLRAIELLETVGIANAAGVYEMYPHQLSGGQRQRVVIAMALACNPRLIVADEPTTALDVTMQAQILARMRAIVDKSGMSVMLITHDLGVIAEMADYVVVMYAGKVVEKGTVEEVFACPLHPYTLGLLRAKPVVGQRVDRLYNIRGSVPNPVDMPDHCYFRDRCDCRLPACNGAYPDAVEVSMGHCVACYRATEVAHE